MSSSELASHCVLVFIIVSGIILLRRVLLLSYAPRVNRLPLPPGPRGLPIIGNLHQAPKDTTPWRAYKKWSDQYGPIMTIRNGRTVSIVITSFDIVNEFLGKHNAIFSSRPQLVMLDRVSKGVNTSFLPYGAKWNTHRVFRSNVLKPSMLQKYRPLLDLETKQLLHELLSSEDFSACLRRQAVSIFLTIAYGERLVTETTEVREMEKVVAHMGAVSEASFRGTNMLVEFFPFLDYLWVNAKWKTEADELFVKLTSLFVKKWRDGLRTPAWNWTKEYSLRKEAEQIDEMELAHMIGSIYEAALTPFEIIRIILLAALIHPEDALRLQNEIEQVVGPDRLPIWEDIDQLPQVMAFVFEALRWRTFSPLAAPRAATQDVEYNGYRIPKGATIVINQWAMDHDEQIFEDPFTFRPRRWLDNPDLPHIIWGFGLRGCPGQFLARSYLSLTVLRIFWGFNVERAVNDRKSTELDIPALMESRGGVSFFNNVPSFKASLVVRDEKRKLLIEGEWQTADKNVESLLGKFK